MTVHECLERDKLGQLSTQNFGVSTKVMNHALRSLLVFGKVTTLEETICRGRRVHEEVGWSVQFNDYAADLVRVAFVVLQVDGLDVRKRILDLVPCLFVVDIVGHSALVRRVEDDEVHGVLAHTRPFADAERATCQVVDHCDSLGADP